MIAASIVAAAAHNLMALRSSTRWTRLGVAFGFGLFHGLGFAGGLLVAMSGMAGIGVATAIAAFSVGVEIGHQLVAVPLFVGLQLLQRFETSGAPLARRAGSAVVLLAGLYYFGHALP
jgi:hypothetical protein